MIRILVITRHTPLPWEDGAGAYLFDLMQYLHLQGHEVHLAWLQPHDRLVWKGVWKPPAAFAGACSLHLPGAFRLGHWQIFPGTFWLPFKARSLHWIKQGLLKLGLGKVISARRPASKTNGGGVQEAKTCGWMSPPSSQEADFAAKILGRLQPDVVLVNYPWLCPLFDFPLCAAARRICVSVDVAWKRSRLLAVQSGEKEPEVTADREAAWLRKAEVTLAISASDARDFEELNPGCETLVLPKAFHFRARPAMNRTRRPSCLFVGSDNPFNREGLTWFLTEIWPLVRSRCPEAELTVAGSIDQCVTLRPAGVCFLGRVEDLTGLYHQSEVVVVPLLRATGMNIKLAEAVAHGSPCIVSPAALESVPFFRGCVLEAPDASAFVEGLLGIWRDAAKGEELGRLAEQVARERLDPQSCYYPLGAWLARWVAGGRGNSKGR